MTITVTEIARKKILDLLEREPRRDLALRFAVEGPGPGGFRYRLGFVPPEEARPEDTRVDGGGFPILIDQESAPKLEGAALDFIETLTESGFKIDNPNSPWSDPIAAAIQRVLDHEINPAIAAHGGAVTLLEVKDGVAYVQMSGGCQGCGMAHVTLSQGIEQRIREAVPDIESVVDTTDHAGGTNPYYRSSGESPLA